MTDVTLVAACGSVTLVEGPNGSGRSTLLRIGAGVLDPGGGPVDVASEPPGRGAAAAVPAGDRMLLWRLTGRQNLEFIAAVGGRTKHKVLIEEVAESLLAGHLLDQPVAELSTGQRRSLTPAAGFVTGPPVLLLDELLSDLDESPARIPCRH